MIARITHKNKIYTVYRGILKIQIKGTESFKVIEIPKKARGKNISIIDNKVMIGKYVLNEEKDIFEKIGGWLSFLQNLLILVKNLFKKDN